MHHHRRAGDAHQLDLGGGRDDAGDDVGAPVGQGLDHLAVQPLAPVHHREEGDDVGPPVNLGVHELAELLEGPQRQCGGDERDQKGVGGVELTLSDTSEIDGGQSITARS